jgi:chromate reductase
MLYNIGVIVGSLSPSSINRRLFRALTKLAPEAGLSLTEIPIEGLPFYSVAQDEAPPAASVAFKEAISASDGIIIVTPEYNRSVPGVLKNALDIASRPRGANSFAGKPSAVLGASLGPVGTAVAQQHLRSILSFLASPELAQPELYLQMREGLIGEDGDPIDESLASSLRAWLTAVHLHVARTLSSPE